jgi:thiamine-phosphate pyrophosphorylase
VKLLDLKDRLKLYVILDRRLGRGVPLCDQARLAIQGGATAIQLRDKRMQGRDCYRASLAIKEICKEKGVLFIVNDRLDVALTAGADGVHLGQEDLPLEAAEKIAPEGFIIGISVRTPDQAIEAERKGADYLGVGDVFGTSSKPDAKTIGIEGLEEVCKSTSLPCVAIGGIGVHNVKQALQAGAVGVAVISAVISQKDIAGAARTLRSLVS